MFSKKTFLVLGSNSFSGAVFVSYLVGQPEIDLVIGVSRSDEPDDAFLPYRHHTEINNKFVFLKLDLNYHTQEIVDAVKQYKVTHIVNFAAQGMVAQSWVNPDQWFRTNALSLALLIKNIYKINHIESFVQASTPEVYGVCDNASESRCYAPSTPYAASKVAADGLLHAYFKSHGFPVRFTRSANVYGAGQQLYRIIPKTVMTILKQGKLPLHGGGTSVRSFIHMNDVSDATYKIACSGINGEIYHVSGSQVVSIKELVFMICHLMEVNPQDYVLESAQRSGADSLYLLNAEKIEHQLNWKPVVNLELGLEEVIDWVKKNFETLKNVPLEYLHKE